MRLKEMTHYKLMYFLLIVYMHVLKLMQRFKPFDIQTIGQYNFRFAFQQMFTFTCRYFTHGGKHISFIGAPELYAGFTLNTKFSCFGLPFEKWKMCIEHW